MKTGDANQVMQMRKRARCMVPFIAILLSLLSRPATAGDIALTIKATTKVTGPNVDLQFTVTNNGTERAVDVVLTARLLTRERRVKVADILPPGETAMSAVGLRLPESVEGTFPIYIDASYLSMENMPYSSAALAVVRTPKALVSDLSLSLEHSSVDGEHLLRVELGDPSSQVDQSRLVCHTPDDLFVPTEAMRVRFQSGKSTALFPIKNLKGQPGSRYGVFVTAAYERGGVHYLAYADITIPIAEASIADSGSGDGPREGGSAFLSLLGRYRYAIGLLILVGVLTAFGRTRHTVAGIFGKKKA